MGYSTSAVPAPRSPRAWLTAGLGALLAAACSDTTPPPQTGPGNCAVLSTLCDSCTQQSQLATCNDAVTRADDAQCEAVLSELQSACVPRDGGAADGALVDAASLPRCGGQATADAGCACEDGGCSTSCPGGGCSFTCVSGTCTPSCSGGRCTILCLSGATCEASCAGGGCVIDCKNGSTCASSCPGGRCTFQCEEGAICNDTCGSAGTCIGP